jgi:hypothetical protein
MSKIKIKSSDIITFLVIFILVTSIFGLYMNRQDTVEKNTIKPSFFYNDIAFYENSVGNYVVYLQTQGDPFPVEFNLDPRTMSDIYVEKNIKSKIRNATKIYSTYNPNTDKATPARMVGSIIELGRMVPFVTVNRVSPALAYTEDDNPIDLDIPIKTCSDATYEIPVILFEIGEENKIYSEDFCVHVVGISGDELMRSADAMSYSLVGIN